MSFPHRFQIHHQRLFLPNGVNLLVSPVAALFAQLKIKVPEHASQDRSHLRICKTKGKRKGAVSKGAFLFQGKVLHPLRAKVGLSLLPSNTIPWSKRKWLQSISIVICKFWIWVREPALGKERIWLCEVRF